jgi:hypothetical protein
MARRLTVSETLQNSPKTAGLFHCFSTVFEPLRNSRETVQDTTTRNTLKTAVEHSKTVPKQRPETVKQSSKRRRKLFRPSRVSHITRFAPAPLRP